MNESLLMCVMCLGLLAPAARAEPDPPQNAAPPAQTADTAYSAGATALDEKRWRDAVGDFDQVIKANAAKADAALYWKAYALNKLNSVDLADATCRQLRTQFPASRWNRDCSTLRLTQQPGEIQIAIPPINIPSFDIDLGNPWGGASKDPNADIKILALSSLMHRDPAQAIPLLRGILTGDQPVSVKKHALFVLTQSKAPEADALMRDLIAGKMGVELQRQAIQSSGIYRGRRSDDALVEAYRATADEQVKRAVISSLYLAGDDERLVELARAEKNLELKRRIVAQLAIMSGKAAQDYMLELLK
jgi:hypothetical protein